MNEKTSIRRKLIKSPKISIIVPVYNTEKYLRKCLDSLMNQTISDIEVVIVNDGSTDSSSRIINEYVEKYPEKICYLSQENSGQAVARNNALSFCTGEYIGFLDSDDYMDLTYCEKIYSIAKTDNADCVACGGSEVQYENDGSYTLINKYFASKTAFNQIDLFFDVHVQPTLHIYKKSIIVNSGVLFPVGMLHEDTAFYLNMIPHINKIATIEEPLFFRVRRSGSSTMTLDKARVADIFSVIDNILCYYKEHNYWEEWEDEVTYFCLRILTGSSVHRISWINNYFDRIELVKKTLKYINSNFPNYQKNPYLKKNIRGMYIRHFSYVFAMIIISLYRIKERFLK